MFAFQSLVAWVWMPKSGPTKKVSCAPKKKWTSTSVRTALWNHSTTRVGFYFPVKGHFYFSDSHSHAWGPIYIIYSNATESFGERTTSNYGFLGLIPYGSWEWSPTMRHSFGRGALVKRLLSLGREKVPSYGSNAPITSLPQVKTPQGKKLFLFLINQHGASRRTR